jgi:hypothetical protein
VKQTARSALLAVIALVVAVPAWSQELPVPGPVPSDIFLWTAEDLGAERERLLAARGELGPRIARFENNCSKVSPDDTARVAGCRAEYQPLVKAIEEYGRDLKRYNQARQQAQAAAVAPGRFVTPEERAFLGREIQRLEGERSRVENVLATLDRRLDEQREFARQHALLQREILFGSAEHAVAVLEAAIDLIKASGQVPPRTLDALGGALDAAKGALGRAKDATDPVEAAAHAERATTATRALVSLLQEHAAGSGGQQWNILVLGAQTLNEVTQGAFQAVRTGRLPWEAQRARLDDFVAAMGRYFSPLKSARGTAHILVGEAALWKIRRDQTAIDQALSQTGMARRYYEERLRDTVALLDFYRERAAR